jgi:uncharacterized protein YndB with AHSA1/START domain
MTHELRVERLIDGPAEKVFDAFVDPQSQKTLYNDPDEPGWMVESDLDLRVDGTWTISFGTQGKLNRETNVFTEIERPRRIVFNSTMFLAGDNREFHTTIVVTFEERDGRTLVTIDQRGFERQEDRDLIESGWPNILDALQNVFAGRGTK